MLIFLVITICGWYLVIEPIAPGGFLLRDVITRGLWMGLTFVCACYLLNVLWREPTRKILRQDLQKLGVPICVDCGYDLRGQRVARCPECGTGFDPGLLSENGSPA